MKLVLKLSLEHITFVKIATLLWNQNDVRALIVKHKPRKFVTLSDAEWVKIEERVIETISQLSLPKVLKEKVLGFIKPIGIEIFWWMNQKVDDVEKYLRVNLPAEFCWTPQGTIDRKKTAEILVRDENLDLSTRFRLASVYCLENDINELWNISTEDLKKSLLATDLYFTSAWSRIMMRRGSDSAHISYKDEFKKSACSQNKAAVEHFLQKLIPTEKEESLVEAAKYVSDAEILCFLLNKMDENQQSTALKKNIFGALGCFLDWPFQSLFMAVASRMWDFLKDKMYDCLLRDIVWRIEEGYKDWDYQELFREFWQESPSAKKSSITNEMHKSWLVIFLFRTKDKENIRLIFEHATPMAKETLIYSDRMDEELVSYICNNEWDFLEFCIQECLPSKSKILNFKKAFERRMMRSDMKKHFKTKKQKWDQLLCFSDDSTFKLSKRSSEECECSSSKRLK